MARFEAVPYKDSEVAAGALKSARLESLGQDGFNDRIGGARAPEAARTFTERVEEKDGRLVAKFGIVQLRHDFFEPAAKFEGGNHRAQRVAVARIDDGLQNFHGFLLEFGESRRG